MTNLEEIYYEVDDFCMQFIPAWRKSLIQSGEKHRDKAGRLSESEVITLLILFHQLQYRNFKTFYKNISQIEHSRHRSPISFMVHLLAGLIAYTFQPKKPRIRITRSDENALM